MAGTIELDLLIVGGGIQGLTLLHRFVEDGGKSAVLVSRDPLGSGETLHSHGYMHRGYFLPPEAASRIPDHAESFDAWTRWMRRQGLEYEESEPIFFDLAQEQYETITSNWTKGGLTFESVDELPAPLVGGVYSRPHARRLVTIHDRLIPAWRIVETLSKPLQHFLVRGELTGLSWDPGTNRIEECTARTSDGDVCFRAKAVVLASGRETQPLLRNIAGADGTRPFRETPQDRHLIRDVPMILIRGKSLPSLSGWFFLEAPITMMTHPLESGERMWVVTLMEGHHTSRDDFEAEAGRVEASVTRRTLEALWNMIPQLRESSGQLRFSSYVGAKIDHPEGPPKWLIGDAGIRNLRFVWPVLWGLAHGAARELLRDLTESSVLDPSTRGGDFDAARFGLRTGVDVGEEKRLSPSLHWQTLEEFDS